MTRRQTSRPGLSALLFLAASVSGPGAAGEEPSLSALAKRYFDGVYGCDAAVVGELASPDVVVSYPVFEELFGSPAVRGRDAVRAFAERFCRRWTDAETVVHEVVADGNRVVLLWSFSARSAGAAPDEPRSAWGGITLFRFDEEGRIAAEIGEESAPGPMGRLDETLRD